MTDNILTHLQAAIAMLKGERVEAWTKFRDLNDWRPVELDDFDDPITKFRRPPEPRREARMVWVNYGRNGIGIDAYSTRERAIANSQKADSETAVPHREVLPDEVVVRVLGIDDARLALHKAINAIEFGNKTDDKLIIAQLADQGVYLTKEGKP